MSRGLQAESVEGGWRRSLGFLFMTQQWDHLQHSERRLDNVVVVVVAAPLDAICVRSFPRTRGRCRYVVENLHERAVQRQVQSAGGLENVGIVWDSPEYWAQRSHERAAGEVEGRCDRFRLVLPVFLGLHCQSVSPCISVPRHNSGCFKPQLFVQSHCGLAQ